VRPVSRKAGVFLFDFILLKDDKSKVNNNAVKSTIDITIAEQSLK